MSEQDYVYYNNTDKIMKLLIQFHKDLQSLINNTRSMSAIEDDILRIYKEIESQNNNNKGTE